MVVRNGIFGIILICFLFSSCKNKKADIEKDEMDESVVHEMNIEENDTVEGLDQKEYVVNDMSIEKKPVSTYRFKPGTYYMLDGVVNVRAEPNLSGGIIGQLAINSQIKITECAFNEQVIDGVTAYWYKIEYNNSYGYIWGGYIAVETLIYDIDNNGVNDYFHYRFSDIINSYSVFATNYERRAINGYSDVFVYMNNEIVPLELILYYYSPSSGVSTTNNYIWEICEFYEPNSHTIYDWDGVIISLFSSTEGCQGVFGVDQYGELHILASLWK